MPKPRLITAAERAARRERPAAPAATATNAVIWRKKGCKSCQPIVVPTRVTIAPTAS